MRLEIISENFDSENNTYNLRICAPGYNKDNMKVQSINNRLTIEFDETEYFNKTSYGTDTFKDKVDKVKVNLNNGIVDIIVSFKTQKESVISAIFE